MTHIRQEEAIVKHTLTCACGEIWGIYATQHDYNFELEKASTFIQRSLHRLFLCPLASFHLDERQPEDFLEKPR